jgi:enterochelin esterase-like enzyme
MYHPENRISGVRKSALAALLLPLLLGGLRGQDAPPLRSCEVNADGSITFRYRDTGAHKVAVNLENTAAPLAMEVKDGVWTATSLPQKPEIYWYSFQVDGKQELDPLNTEVFRNLVYLNSFVTVPGSSPQPWDEMDVPHGVVHHHFYTSKVVKGLPGGHSDFYVYTPPGYEPGASRPYPVLYLLHGYSQTAADWCEIGKANVILDNLIAQGKARPMVVVMPFGYGDMSIISKDFISKIVSSDSLFGQALVGEVLPMVEAAYRVSGERGDRAIAGLSMGGLESLEIGLGHPELFAWVGSFSGAARFVQDSVDRGEYDPVRARLRLLWISCGADEGNGLIANRKLVASLKARNFAVTAVEVPGMHTWMVWHDNLIHFAPLLFRN